ncbi:hypothetical protein Tco_1506082 [Tanacetum coccineum]
MTPESVQAMIDQALLRNSTNRDGSHSLYGDNRRNVQTTRPCFSFPLHSDRGLLLTLGGLVSDKNRVKSENRNRVVEPKGQRNDVQSYTKHFQRYPDDCVTKFVSYENERLTSPSVGLPDYIYGK